MNKNDYPGEFVKRQTDPSENKTKTEKESKNAYEKSRGEFPILKFQTDRDKNSKNKIGKVSRKNPELFPILFFEKILDEFYISFTSSYRILPYHHG